jgi:hypothetical protein
MKYFCTDAARIAKTQHSRAAFRLIADTLLRLARMVHP